MRTASTAPTCGIVFCATALSGPARTLRREWCGSTRPTPHRSTFAALPDRRSAERRHTSRWRSGPELRVSFHRYRCWTRRIRRRRSPRGRRRRPLLPRCTSPCRCAWSSPARRARCESASAEPAVGSLRHPHVEARRAAAVVVGSEPAGVVVSAAWLSESRRWQAPAWAGVSVLLWLPQLPWGSRRLVRWQFWRRRPLSRPCLSSGSPQSQVRSGPTSRAHPSVLRSFSSCRLSSPARVTLRSYAAMTMSG